MAITSYGYPGTITPGTVWARVAAWGVGARYAVNAGDQFRVTALSGGTRQVSVSSGWAAGWGILDNNTAAATVTLPTETFTGTRYYLIVLRRSWSSTVGASVTSLVALPGTATAAIPTRNTTPGDTDDQPLALVPLTAGDTVPGTPIDLRVVGSGSGPFTAVSELVLTYMAFGGVVIRIGTTTWYRVMNTAGAATWSKDPGSFGRVALPTATQGQVWQGLDAAGVATGFSGGGGSGIGCEATSDGNDVQVAMTLRRTGAAIVAASEGGVVGGDTTIGRLVDPYIPSTFVVGAFIYRGGSAATSRSTYGGFFTVYTNGQMIINQLAPDSDLVKSSTSDLDDWAARFFFKFTRKDAS